MIKKTYMESRVKRFLGYGNLRSDYWFIGMEEGFHGDEIDLKKRFIRTKGKMVVDLQNGMSGIKDHSKWFSNNSPIQRTWGKLIRILLAIKSDTEIGEKEISEFQRRDFARSKGDHCALELMPLPCRSTKYNDWNFKNKKISYLNSRSKYKKEIMPLRIILIRKTILKYKPKIVIFYSLTYLSKWQELIDCKLLKKNGFYYCLNRKTHYFVIPHPNKHGMKNSEWKKIAANIKRMVE